MISDFVFNTNIFLIVAHYIRVIKRYVDVIVKNVLPFLMFVKFFINWLLRYACRKVAFNQLKKISYVQFTIQRSAKTEVIILDFV